jgi:hypothetical protein
MKLKLDLHTHCFEATVQAPPTEGIVRQIIAAAKARGLDGIAITEHEDKSYAYKVKEIVNHRFASEILIIPGQEITVAEMAYAEVVELYLPDGATFRFLPHPSYPYPGDFSWGVDSLHGIEISNYLHDRQLNKAKIREVAQKYHLLLLENSDAHSLSNIGAYYNEIDLEELYHRADQGVRQDSARFSNYHL